MQQTSKPLKETNLNEVRGLILDMDGVLYRGNEALPGLVRFFATMDDLAVAYYLVTNNASRTPAQFAEKLAKLGVTILPAKILTSSGAAGRYLRANAPVGSTFALVGEEALRQAVLDANADRGFREGGASADYVVAGIDFHLTYDKLREACLAIRAGARFIATNTDATYPSEQGLLPGAGSIIAALVTATDRQPDLVMGKPETPLIDEAIALLGLPHDQVMMVGDRIDTDILGGIRAGLATILLLTGVSTLEELATSIDQPDLVYDNLDELSDALIKAATTRRENQRKDPGESNR